MPDPRSNPSFGRSLKMYTDANGVVSGVLKPLADVLLADPANATPVLSPIPFSLAQCAIPIIIPPTTGTNTISTAGIITCTGITFGQTYPTNQPCWVYLPANTAGTGAANGAEGLYYGTITQSTAPITIQVYTNYINPANAFTPYIPASPVAAVGSNAAIATLAGTTCTLANVTVPGGMMGPNGILRHVAQWSVLNNAGVKSPKSSLGGQCNGYASMSLASITGAEIVRNIRNRGDQAKQVFGASTTVGSNASNTPLFTTASPVNTAVDQPFLFTCNVATATDYAVLEGYTLEVIPG